MVEKNITGFDPQKFAAASGPSARDPWRRREAWRYTGPFTRRNRFEGLFPGLGLGTGAFAVYLVVEALFLKKHDHGHGPKDQHGVVV